MWLIIVITALREHHWIRLSGWIRFLRIAVCQHTREEGRCQCFLIICFLRFGCDRSRMLRDSAEARSQNTIRYRAHIKGMLRMLKALHQLITNVRLQPFARVSLHHTVRSLHQFGAITIAGCFEQDWTFGPVFIGKQILDLFTVTIRRRWLVLLVLTVIRLPWLSIAIEVLAILRRCLMAYPSMSQWDVVIWDFIIFILSFKSRANVPWTQHLALHLHQVASVVVKQDANRQQVERQAKENSREVRTEAFAFYIEAYQKVVDDTDQVAGREKEQDVRQRVDLLSKVVTAVLVEISDQGSCIGS